MTPNIYRLKIFIFWSLHKIWLCDLNSLKTLRIDFEFPKFVLKFQDSSLRFQDLISRIRENNTKYSGFWTTSACVVYLKITRCDRYFAVCIFKGELVSVVTKMVYTGPSEKGILGIGSSISGDELKSKRSQLQTCQILREYSMKKLTQSVLRIECMTVDDHSWDRIITKWWKAVIVNTRH